MLMRNMYYAAKPFMPRSLQLLLRRRRLALQRRAHADSWPIDPHSSTPPAGWSGWPDNKRFAVILTHDVETARGQDKCRQLAALERQRGFRSSFNFVPERYEVAPDLRVELRQTGFEVGVHGLKHDGKLYRSHQLFQDRATRINQYLEAWEAVGFRSPAMHHNLSWLHALNIQYDASTFDTDPFEAQPDGVGTIFPFWVADSGSKRGYVELPYTLPQDFTLFILMQERSIDIWTRKIDWVAARGGMVLVNTHPDYMQFGFGKPTAEVYPSAYYEALLDYLIARYSDQYWHVLPRDLAAAWPTLNAV
jgi:hypothetical protein